MPAPDEIAIQPLDAPIDADVRVPGSKSYTNRALVLAGLAAGRSTLEGALFSDDTRYMAEALRQLGIEVDADEATARFSVQGCDGVIPATEASVFIGNSGTTARFLPVMMALGHGRYELDGVERMHQRPIHPLIDA
ncbi:MAG: hypothetical protein PVI30_16550, partial [Myxococcales bacterium]